MKIFDNQEEFLREKQKFEGQLLTDPTNPAYNFVPNAINWISENSNFNNLRGKIKEMSMPQKDKQYNPIFLLSSKDDVSGKPQLVHQTRQKIVLMRYTVSENKNGDLFYLVRLFDESYDKRYDGILEHEFCLDFWVYKLISNDKEYFLLSEKELPLTNCKFQGMSVEVGDFSEFKKTVRFKSLSNVFFVRDFTPDVKILSKDDLVSFAKDKFPSILEWYSFLNYHPTLHSLNNFISETNLLRSSFLLSGKVDGYPLHLSIVGGAGTKKSSGHLETLKGKFGVEIYDGSVSRLKGLTPSFKEKPANQGYLASCDRIGLVDELFKMVEQISQNNHNPMNNLLGEFNPLLEHKQRVVSSGNDNLLKISPTAKFIDTNNPKVLRF